MNMYNVFVCIVVEFRCKVTTFSLTLYQLPMENMKNEQSWKWLRINKLQKSVRCTLWKMLVWGMERKTYIAIALQGVHVVNRFLGLSGL